MRILTHTGNLFDPLGIGVRILSQAEQWPNRVAAVADTSNDWVLDDITQRLDELDADQNDQDPGELRSWVNWAEDQVKEVSDDPDITPDDRRQAYDLLWRLQRVSFG